MKYKPGDIVRHTTKFLRSVGWYTNVPINGCVREVRDENSGYFSGFPVVEWSDGHTGLINPANIERCPRGWTEVVA